MLHCECVQCGAINDVNSCYMLYSIFNKLVIVAWYNVSIRRISDSIYGIMIKALKSRCRLFWSLRCVVGFDSQSI